jgi:hypothetical protein
VAPEPARDFSGSFNGQNAGETRRYETVLTLLMRAAIFLL